jgi:signal transduction histidine kinase/CheY-like chemotaxis protein
MGRKLGIDIAAEAPWGSHFAFFYEVNEDLIKISIPFLRAGLESNEYCLWVTPKYESGELEQIMRSSVPNFETYKKKQQFEIMPYLDWHLYKNGYFGRPLEKASEKYNQALANGYDGLRFIGDLSWAESEQWDNIKAYEADLDKLIEKNKMIVICSYSYEKCNADYILHILASHQLGFIKSGEGFEIIEASLIKIKRKLFGKEIVTRKKLEEQLIQSQKMEAVGRLAGGVAHDFNNLLMVILGHDEFLIRKLHPDDPLYRDAQAIQQAAERAAALTRQLLAFSRKQILQFRILNLNEVVEHVQGMLRRLIGEDIEMITVLDAALGNVKADPGQIEQVIMNLAINARDAMPRGGKLAISTANIEFPVPHYCKFETLPPGRYVMLSVSDTGVGLDAEMQAHVFEPFYTTKELGKGTGLGLSTVYGIAKQSEGCIDVDSQPGLGTTFKIYFPRVEESMAAAAEPAPSSRLHGSETILVVEDSDMVRELITDALQMHGYKVLAARNGDEALRLFEQHQGPIHLMLTDVVMPKMSGQELFRRLAPLHPEMKVLYMSAYAEDVIGSREVLEQGINFIQKPFTLDMLLQTVRQMINTRPPTRLQ